MNVTNTRRPSLRESNTDRTGESAPSAPPRAGAPAGSNSPAMHVLSVLLQLGNGGQAHSLTEIATAADLPSDTVCRILARAVEHGLVHRPRRGLYLMSRRTEPATMDEAPEAEDDILLTLLQESAQAPAALFAPALGLGAAARFLIAHVYGPYRDKIRSAPARELAALQRSSLRADPAGQAILTHMLPKTQVPQRLLPVLHRGLAVGNSPISGLAMVAAPVWHRRSIAGSVAVLPPRSVLSDPTALTRIADLLHSTAAAYSHRSAAPDAAAAYFPAAG